MSAKILDWEGFFVAAQHLTWQPITGGNVPRSRCLLVLVLDAVWDAQFLSEMVPSDD